MLPAHVRLKIERRLFQNGIRDYEGLAQWVRDEGYNISEDSLWRYGRRSLQEEMLAGRVSALQAAALADLPDARSAIAQTWLTIAQQKALETPLDQEELRPALLNALARMISTAHASSLAASGPASSSGRTAEGKRDSASAPADQASQSEADSGSPPTDKAAGISFVPTPAGQKPSVGSEPGLLDDNLASGIQTPASAPVRRTRREPHLPNEPESSFAAASVNRAAMSRAQSRPSHRRLATGILLDRQRQPAPHRGEPRYW